MVRKGYHNLNAWLALISLVILLSVWAPLVRAQDDQDGGERPCGFKIAPCPQGSTCSAHDPSCPATRGENCLGTCVTATPACGGKGHEDSHPIPTVVAIPTTPPERETPPRVSWSPPVADPAASAGAYEDCGGDRLVPKNCPEGYRCIDDARVGGCGMACDAPGICVAEVVACAGKIGRKCPKGLVCYDAPGDGCDPEEGGWDCGGICLFPPAP